MIIYMASVDSSRYFGAYDQIASEPRASASRDAQSAMHERQNVALHNNAPIKTYHVHKIAIRRAE